MNYSVSSKEAKLRHLSGAYQHLVEALELINYAAKVPGSSAEAMFMQSMATRVHCDIAQLEHHLNKLRQRTKP